MINEAMVEVTAETMTAAAAISVKAGTLYPLASLWLEASVVAIVNTVFLCLFVAAGIRQIIKNKQQQ